MMNDALAGMIPYESIGLYEQPKPRFLFKMPRVVPEQKSKFESDELFRRLSRETEVVCECKYILINLRTIRIEIPRKSQSRHSGFFFFFSR